MDGYGSAPEVGAGGRARTGPPRPPRPPRDGEGQGDGAGGARLVEVDVERDVIGTPLYRERVIVEEVVEEGVGEEEDEEEDAIGPGAAARRRRDGRRDSRRARAAKAREGLRATLAYKLLFDLVCNRAGVVLMGFGLALLLFSALYDPLRHEPLSIGPRQLMAMVVAGVVYFVGMALEMLRAWSPECEEGREAPPVALRSPRRDGDAPIPLVPEEALEKLERGPGAGGRPGGR